MPLDVLMQTRSKAAHQRFALVDTTDHYDAWATGRDGPEDHRDGMGLLVTYDGSGSVPSLTLNGPDGEVSLVGVAEIGVVAEALTKALALAQAFASRSSPSDARPSER